MKNCLFLLVAIALICVSCGTFSKWQAGMTGHTEITIDGVVYLQFPSGVTVKYNSDGTICKKKE